MVVFRHSVKNCDILDVLSYDVDAQRLFSSSSGMPQVPTYSRMSVHVPVDNLRSNRARWEDSGQNRNKRQQNAL